MIVWLKMPDSLTAERLDVARRAWNASGQSEKAMVSAAELSKDEKLYLRMNRDLLSDSPACREVVETREEGGVQVKVYRPGYAIGAEPQKNIRVGYGG